MATYEKEIKFLLEDVEVGGSFITVTNGKIDTAAAEEQFYAVLRKHAKSIVQEAEENEHDAIVSDLNSTQEDKLKEAHAKDYHGTDDDMPDAYESWLMDLSVDELKKILV